MWRADGVDSFFFLPHVVTAAENTGFSYDLAMMKKLVKEYHYVCDAQLPTLVCLCEANAQVCEANGLAAIASVWAILATLVEVQSVKQDEDRPHRSGSVISPPNRAGCVSDLGVGSRGNSVSSMPHENSVGDMTAIVAISGVCDR